MKYQIRSLGRDEEIQSPAPNPTGEIFYKLSGAADARVIPVIPRMRF